MGGRRVVEELPGQVYSMRKDGAPAPGAGEAPRTPEGLGASAARPGHLAAHGGGQRLVQVKRPGRPRGWGRAQRAPATWPPMAVASAWCR